MSRQPRQLATHIHQLGGPTSAPLRGRFLLFRCGGPLPLEDGLRDKRAPPAGSALRPCRRKGPVQAAGQHCAASLSVSLSVHGKRVLLTNNCVCTCQQAPICFPRLSLGHGGFSQSPCGIPCGIVPNRPKNLRRTFHPQTLRCKWHMCLAYTGPPVHSPCTGAAKEFSYLHVGIPDTAPLPTPRRTGACQQQCPDPLPRSAAAAPAPAHLRAPARPCPAGPQYTEWCPTH